VLIDIDNFSIILLFMYMDAWVTNRLLCSVIGNRCRDLQSATQRLELTEFEVKFTSSAVVRPQLPFSWIVKTHVDQLIYQGKQQR